MKLAYTRVASRRLTIYKHNHLTVNYQTGPDGAVAKSSTNGLVDTGLCLGTGFLKA